MSSSSTKPDWILPVRGVVASVRIPHRSQSSAGFLGCIAEAAGSLCRVWDDPCGYEADLDGWVREIIESAPTSALADSMTDAQALAGDWLIVGQSIARAAQNVSIEGPVAKPSSRSSLKQAEQLLQMWNDQAMKRFGRLKSTRDHLEAQSELG